MSKQKPSGSTLFLATSLIIALVVFMGGGYWWHAHSSTSIKLPPPSAHTTNPMVLQNSRSLPFTVVPGRKPTGRAKALASSSQAVLPPALVFATKEGSQGDKVMDIYLDLSSAPSRDFLLTEQASLKEWVEEGRLTLRVHPLLSANPSTLYAFNGVSELATKAPEEAWEGLLLLTREAPAWGQGPRPQQVETVAKLLQPLSPSLTPTLVSQGEFVEWLSLSGKDKKLTQLSALPLPLVYLNDRLLTPTTGDLDNSGVLRKEVLS